MGMYYIGKNPNYKNFLIPEIKKFVIKNQDMHMEEI